MFENGLSIFLTKLFDAHVKTGGEPDYDLIYGDYNRSLTIGLEIEDSKKKAEVVALLRGFREMEGAEKAIHLQKKEGKREFDLAAHYGFYVDGSNHQNIEPLDNLLNCVYWFLSGDDSWSEKRVYVHVKHPLSINGIAILKVLVPKLGKLQNFNNVKMFGPVPARERNDTIVAYCASREAQAAVAKAVIELGEQYVELDLPNFIKHKGKGVGIADEPPQVDVFEGDRPQGEAQSFGKFLSKLIAVAWAAWINTGKKSKEEFFELVRIAMVTARLDPLRPHKHSHRAEVESMEPGLAAALEAALE